MIFYVMLIIVVYIIGNHISSNRLRVILENNYELYLIIKISFTKIVGLSTYN